MQIMKKYITSILLLCILSSSSCNENVTTVSDTIQTATDYQLTTIQSEDLSIDEQFQPIVLPEVQEKEDVEVELEFAKPTIQNNGTQKLQVYNSMYTIPENLENDIYTIVNKYPKLKIGAYAISLKDNTCIGYNESDPIDTASSVKAPFALFVMKEISKGNHTLDEEFTYTQKHYFEGSGQIQYSKLGTVYSVKQLVEYMIDCSDNVAYLMLQDYFGYEGYNELISELGCSLWLNDYTKWGKFSAEELAIIWNEIYNFSSTCEEGKYLLELLVNAKYNFIKDSLNCYDKVAHKSGFSAKAYNDAAIIFGNSNTSSDTVSTNPNDYILVVMTSPGNSGYNKACLSEIANAYDSIMRDLAYFQE